MAAEDVLGRVLLLLLDLYNQWKTASCRHGLLARQTRLVMAGLRPAMGRPAWMRDGQAVYGFLVPLLVGFGFNLASAFTSSFSRRWGEQAGRWVTFVLRVVLGMPLWILGLALAMRAPSPFLFDPFPAQEAVAWAVITIGTLPMALGLWALRKIAALPSVRDTLTERGVYSRVRHPIYAGMLLEFMGMALLRPTLAVLLACGLGLAWAVVQARAEERDLVRRVPSYRAYMSRVPPFFPRKPTGQ